MRVKGKQRDQILGLKSRQELNVASARMELCVGERISKF